MKRLTTIFAIWAVAHVLAASGLAAEGWRRGWLHRERVRDAYAVLSGRANVAEDAKDAPTTQPQRTVEVLPVDEESEPIVRAQLAMQERRIEDAWSELEQRQLALLQDKEAFEAFQLRTRSESEARAKVAGDSGVAKELELIQTIKPKLAKELLRERTDVDVVSILMALDSRIAKKIIDQCKNSEERQWIGRILGQLKDRNAAQAEALGAGISPASGA